jgi:hypothetical protein
LTGVGSCFKTFFTEILLALRVLEAKTLSHAVHRCFARGYFYTPELFRDEDPRPLEACAEALGCIAAGEYVREMAEHLPYSVHGIKDDLAVMRRQTGTLNNVAAVTLCDLMGVDIDYAPAA